jgi:dipeptidyl aminopeptidase/acylaminoacyl peptidase
MLLRESLGAKSLEMRDELLALREQPPFGQQTRPDAALHALDEGRVFVSDRPREDPLLLTPQNARIRVPRPWKRPLHGKNCSVKGMAVTKTRKLPQLEQFFAVRRFSSALTFTADGADVLFASNISGQFNLWRVALEGGWPDQLTAFTDETVRGVGVSPTDGTIVLCADHDGDEFHQLYLVDPERRWPEKLTEAPQVQHFVGSDAWSPDGTRFAYAANARKPTDMETWIRDAETGEARAVFGEGLFSFPAAWSPDGSKLLAVDLRNNSDISVHLVEADGSGARELTPHDEDAIFIPGPWAADGSGFYLVTDSGSEYRGLAFYELATNRYEWVEPLEHDVEDVRISGDGRVLGWIVNADGYDRLRLRDLESGADLPEPDLPGGARPHLTGAEPPLALSTDGSHAALILSSPRRSPEVWIVETEAGRARPVTESRLGGLREEDLVELELVSFPSFDGRDIPAWLYRPDIEGKAPVVLSIHGGPEAQEKPQYQPLYQYLLSRGIGVLATNIRGSTGYGKSYQRLVQRDWGGGDLQDWEHAVKWLQAQDWVDPDRIGVYGGSYGGFAVLTCVTRLPDYWAAAVDIFGPSNLVTFAKAVPPTWKRFIARFVGDPETEADFLMERSPITYVENVNTPLLVIQGATDPRVVKGESDQMVEKLQALGREVEYVVFEDEGHGFTKRPNELKAYRLAAEWLERHLLPA